jgi:hypothetical protein
MGFPLGFTALSPMNDDESEGKGGKEGKEGKEGRGGKGGSGVSNEKERWGMVGNTVHVPIMEVRECFRANGQFVYVLSRACAFLSLFSHHVHIPLV